MEKSMKTIVIGSDHRGRALKDFLVLHDEIGDVNITWLDVGTHTIERTDYPQYAHDAVDVIRTGDAELGILLCGTGVGMSIAANRYPYIYAALAWNQEIAHRAREEDNANILVLPADYVDAADAVGIVYAWLHTTFQEGRYRYRLDQVDLGD
jgi:ribose 5-phosphate isomerase B